jgi:hypothetical protein
MEYPHILNLIDDYLDRLTEARGVLLTFDNPSMSKQQQAAPQAIARKTARRAAKEKQAALALEMIPAHSDEPVVRPKTKPAIDKRKGERRTKVQDSAPTLPFVQEELALQPPREEVVVVEERAPLPEVPEAPSAVKVRAVRRPSTRSKTSTATTARALGGMVSAAPVFIRAEQILQERAQKVPKSGTKEEGSEAVPLTAEMLTQRWVQGLTS